MTATTSWGWSTPLYKPSIHDFPPGTIYGMGGCGGKLIISPYYCVPIYPTQPYVHVPPPPVVVPPGEPPSNPVPIPGTAFLIVLGLAMLLRRKREAP